MTDDLPFSSCFGCEAFFDEIVLRMCSNCHFATYCSEVCQCSDWEGHESVVQNAIGTEVCSVSPR